MGAGNFAGRQTGPTVESEGLCLLCLGALSGINLHSKGAIDSWKEKIDWFTSTLQYHDGSYHDVHSITSDFILMTCGQHVVRKRFFCVGMTRAFAGYNVSKECFRQSILTS